MVEVDPYERGIRAHLNLGHTFGHAIERVDAIRRAARRGGRYRHRKSGQAIAQSWGSLMIRLVEQILKIMWQLELPTDIALDPERWYAAMSTDKKWKAGLSRA